MPPRICDWPSLPVTGRLLSAESDAMRYCGVCATIGYDTPLCGLSQYVGDTWLVPERLATTELVTSCSVMPS